jgi:S1-C subfamily serine protease
VGFAIPVDIVRRVVPELIELGRYRHPWVGVTGSSISPEMVETMELPVETGVLVFQVEPDSPASKAGLRGGETEVVISGRRHPGRYWRDRSERFRRLGQLLGELHKCG